jgi:hypothetical protein
MDHVEAQAGKTIDQLLYSNESGNSVDADSYENRQVQGNVV